MPTASLHVRPDGWIDGVGQATSPNADERPAGTPVWLVVIHNISLPPGAYGGGHVERLFANRLRGGEHHFLDRLLEARVSAHFFIDRVGQCTQFVSCRDRAWHAGASSYRGKAGCNDFSIGIELEGTDFEPYADAQYASLNVLLAALLAAYPIVSGPRPARPFLDACSRSMRCRIDRG
jgi:N-acetyl-anhydromuramoyl-L-alanine amidase